MAHLTEWDSPCPNVSVVSGVLIPAIWSPAVVSRFAGSVSAKLTLPMPGFGLGFAAVLGDGDAKQNHHGEIHGDSR